MRNLRHLGFQHIGRKYEFGELGKFQPKALGNYMHFFCFGNCLGAAAGVQLREDA